MQGLATERQTNMANSPSERGCTVVVAPPPLPRLPNLASDLDFFGYLTMAEAEAVTWGEEVPF